MARLVNTPGTWVALQTFTLLNAIDSGFFVVGSSDATKRIAFEVDAQTAGDTLTINSGAQTDSRTLSVPVLGGNDTIETLATAQTVTGAKTFSAVTTVSNATAATSPTAAALVVAGGIGCGDDLYAKGVVLATGTITTNHPSLVFSQTWNSAPTAFVPFSIAITDTASSGGSLLTDWQVSGVSQFSVTKAGVTVIGADPGGSTQLRVGGGLTINSNLMITTKTNFANGAGAAAGTLTNAPSAGNPTKWIAIDDNGTTRYIPSWT